MDLSLIILLPTFLGGIWQLLELSSISTSFIRFFSISQLIPDGLLILFIFIIIYISVIVSFNMFGKKPFNVDSSKKSLSIWNGILLMSLGSIMFIFGLLPVFQSIYQKRNIQIGEIAIIIPSLMFTVGGFVIGIWRVILSFLQNNKEKTKEVYEKLKGRKELKKNIISFLKIVTISLFFFSLKFIFIDLNPYVTNFRQYILFPENLINREILEDKIIKKNKLKYKPVLIYNNDKYFFYNINSKGKSKILIINSTELTE